MFNRNTKRYFRSVPHSMLLIICCLNGTIINNPTNPPNDMRWNMRAIVVSCGLTHVDRTITESDVSSNMVIIYSMS